MISLVEESFMSFLEKNKKNSKISDRKIFEQISIEINSIRSLNESHLITESKILDKIKKYFQRGLLTTAIIANLLSSHVVSAKELAQAGVPKNQIELAVQTDSKVNYDKLEKAFLDNVNANTAGKYKRSDEVTKKNVLTILQDLTDGNYKQLKDYNFTIIDQAVKDSTDLIPITKMEWTTENYKPVNVVKSYSTHFKFNSADLKNQQETIKMLQDSINGFVNIESITIASSSSTLRNKEDFENKTWKELNTARATAIGNILVGKKYSINDSIPGQTILKDIIKINVKGENGDGTSGPVSPYESQKGYYEGIDSIYWKSQGKGSPYSDIKEYNKHQWVKVIIKGTVLEKDTHSFEKMGWILITVKPEKGGIPGGPSTSTVKPGQVICPEGQNGLRGSIARATSNKQINAASKLNILKDKYNNSNFQKFTKSDITAKSNMTSTNYRK